MANQRAAIVPGPPALLRAVRGTVEAIERRSRVYRWSVVAIASSLVAPVIVALVVMSWHPLVYAIMFAPAVGAFLIIDSWVVFCWQRRILQLWLAEDLRLADLRQTIRAMRHLPTATVTGMLSRLPPTDPPQ